MKKFMFSIVLFALGLSFLTSPCLATPPEYRTSHDPVVMMADGILARPLGLASTIVGSAFFVITLPFTVPSGSVEDAKKQMIEYPAWFTFKRPIGEFGKRYSGARQNVAYSLTTDKGTNSTNTTKPQNEMKKGLTEEAITK